MVLTIEKGKKGRGKNQGFGLGHTKFEMSASCTSTDAK